MPTAPDDGLRARARGVRGAGRALSMRLSSGGYVRAVAEALGGHCVKPAPNRRGPVRRRGSRSGADRPARTTLSAACFTMKSPEVARNRRARRRPAGGGARDLRRSSSRAPAGDRDAARRRAGADRRHVRPAPKTALGNRVELLTSLDRRLELLAELGVEAALVVEFTLDVARLEPQEFAERVLRPIGAETVVAGADFRFGRGRQGDLDAARAARLRREAGSDPGGSLFDRGPERSVAAETSKAPRSSWAGRSRSKASSSPVTPEAERSASRPRTSTSAPSCSCPRTASTPARPSTTAPPSRSARTRTTEAANGASRRSFSTTRRPLRQAARRRALEPAARRARLRQRGRARRADRPRRRAHAQRPKTRLSAS